MPVSTPILTNWTAGELSPYLGGRVDLSKYYNGANLLENMIILTQGGILKRSGSRFISRVKDDSKRVRLYPFVFSTTQAYMLEWGDGYVRPYMDKGRIVDDIDDTTLNDADDLYYWYTIFVPERRWFNHTQIDTVDKQEGGGSVHYYNDALPIWPSSGWAVGFEAPTSWDLSDQDSLFIWIKPHGLPTSPTPTWKIILGKSGEDLEFAIPNPPADVWTQVEVDLSGIDNSAKNQITDLWIDSDYGVDLIPDLGASVHFDHIFTRQTTYVEIETPYTESELRDLRFAQSADVLYIAHKNHQQRKLSRTSHTDWTFSVINNQPGATYEAPYYPRASLNPGSKTGDDVTFTASSSIFVPGDVGRNIIYGAGRAIITEFTNANAVIADIVDAFSTSGWINSGYWYLSGSPDGELKNTPGKRKGQMKNIVTVDEDGTNLDSFRSDDVGKYIYAWGGCLRIHKYINGHKVKAEILKRLQFKTKTPDWTLEASQWSNDLGWPGAVTFFEQRLAWAGSGSFPQTFWLSVSADYENFMKGALDDDGMAFTIAANDVQVVRWLIGATILVAGTVSGEWRIGATGINEALTPSNRQVRNESNYGSAPIQGIRVGSVILYVQFGGIKVRELVYNFQKESYVAIDLTELAEHVTKSGLVEMAFSKNPRPMLYCVRADGQLAVMTYERDEDVVGWSRFVTRSGDSVESVAVLPNSDGSDEIWIATARDVGGSTRRFIEVFEAEFGHETAQDDAFFVDCGLTYDGDAAQNFGGMGHIGGETITVYADGGVHPNVVLGESGSFALNYQASKLSAGLPYIAKVQSVRLEAGQAEGSAQSKIKRIARLAIRLYRSMNVKLASRFDDVDIDIIPFREAWDDMDSPPPLFSGDYELAMTGGYAREGRICIQSDTPTPLCILGLIPTVRTSEPNR